MKKIFSFLIIFVTLGVTLNSCVKDSDYDTPQITCEEPNIPASQLTSISSVLSQWQAVNPGPYDRNMYEFADETADPVYLTGYVVSDDRTGNYYKELYIQDDPVNPQSAVKLMIDMRSLFTKFDTGRKLYVKLNGLGINKSHGEMVIGEVDGGDLINIRENVALKNIVRSCQPEAVSPVILGSPADITSDMIGMYVQLENMQFDLSELGKTFVNAADSYDSHRKMKSCADNTELMLETSTFASFKDNLLPEGSGTVKGIVTRDYRDNYYVLKVNNPEAFDFTGSRCDPPMLDCNGTNIGGPTVVFFDDFESYPVNATSFGSWTNVNVVGGSTVYKISDHQGNKFAQIKAYQSNEAVVDTWLISPAINLDNSTGEELSFKTKTRYNNGAALTVYVSSDYTGDINTATWLLVDAEIADGPSNGNITDFVEGTADISCLSGDVYVAFRYQGGDGGVTTTFQIDDVKVTAN